MKINWRYLLVFVLVALSQARRELAMIQVMFRHGARNTMHGDLLINDPDQAELIRERAELTEVGKRQLFQLGQMIRNEYIVQGEQLLKNQFNSSEIFVLSSNENRTLQSAQSFMAGLYPTGSSQKLPAKLGNDLLLPPFDADGYISSVMFNGYALPKGMYLSAIHSFGEEDAVLNPKCPKYKNQRYEQMNKNNIEIKSEIDKHSEMIKTITQQNIGIKNNFLSGQVTELFDIVHCQKFRGIDYGISETDFATLKYLKTLVKILTKFPQNHSEIIASPVFYFIFKQFDAKIQNKSSLKLIVESTHDGLLMPIMQVLDMINYDCLKEGHRTNTKKCLEEFPAFAANFVFELYNKYDKDGNLQNEREIRIRYNGIYIPICDGQDYCDYTTFKKKVENRMQSPEVYENECGYKPGIYSEDNKTTKNKNLKKSNGESTNSITWLFIVGFILLIVIIVVLVMHIIKIHKRIREEYQPIFTLSSQNK